MKHRTTLAVCATALALSTVQARADARSDLAADMDYFLSYATNQYLTESNVKDAKPASACTAAIAAAQQAGVKPDATLELSYRAKELFPDAPSGKLSGSAVIRVSDAPKLCEAFARNLEAAALKTKVQAGYDMGQWLRLVKPEEVPTSTNTVDKPQRCLDAIDAAKAAGAPRDRKLQLNGEQPTLDDARAYCATVLARAKEFQEAVNTRVAAEAAARRAKYAKHGIKGDRLELFAHYDMEWYLPGCRQSTGDPKKLKTAKVLFQWLTAGDGTITIRKFVFKGDKYRIIDSSYDREGRAYAGCK